MQVELWKRIVAALIDLIIAGILGVIVYLLTIWIPVIGFFSGFFASVVYAIVFGFRDSLPIAALDGASPGKKILGLKAVTTGGLTLDYNTSIRRNGILVAPSLLGAVLGMIPFLGLVLAPLASILGIAVIIFEIIKISNSPEDLRWGDTFAGTKVIAVGAGMMSGGGSSMTPPPPAPSAHQAPPPPPSPTPQPAAAPPPPPPAAEPAQPAPPPPTPTETDDKA